MSEEQTNLKELEEATKMELSRDVPQKYRDLSHGVKFIKDQRTQFVANELSTILALGSVGDDFPEPVEEQLKKIQERLPNIKYTPERERVRDFFLGKTVFDLGCGRVGNASSGMIHLLSQYFGAKRYFGVDVNLGANIPREGLEVKRDKKGFNCIYANEDILCFLAKLKNVTDATFLVGGIESSEEESEYFIAVSDELCRLTHPGDVVICCWTDLEYFLQGRADVFDMSLLEKDIGTNKLFTRK